MVGCYWFYAPLLKFTSAGGLKCLYGFLFIPLTKVWPLRGEISVSEPVSLIIQTQSENKKDCPCHRDSDEGDIPLSGTSFFSYKHPLISLLKQNTQRTFPETAILKRVLELAQMIFTLLQSDLLHRVSFFSSICESFLKSFSRKTCGCLYFI